MDAIQAYGKLKIIPKKLGIDLLTVSGHKIHGPKGTGFIYIKDKTRLRPIILGGGQQKGMRSGTENVPGIAGLGKAVELIYNADFDKKQQDMYELRKWFVSELCKIEGVTINGSEENAAWHVVSASLMESRRRCFYMRWRIKAYMCRQVQHALLTDRDSALHL